MNKNLQNTKVKLTVMFTVLVFLMSIFLESIFFSIKFYNTFSLDNSQFTKQTSNVENRFKSVDMIIKNFNISKRIFSMWNDKLEHPKFGNSDLNILIIDKNKWKLVFSNVIEELNIDFVKKEFINAKYWKVEHDEWYFIKKIFLKDDKWSYEILFIKKAKYPFSYYVWDLLGFILITLLFSAVFYFVWFKFVSRNLKPVEENLADMQDFIHNAWHELKTPIAIINSNLQLIKELKSYDKDLIKEWLIEINKLDHLIESLVELSNINSSERIEKLDLKDEIKNIIKDFKNKSDKNWIKIKFTKIDEKILLMNKQYFYILFSNIISNAIRYNREWWKIDIKLSKNKITIKDTWIWMSSDELGKIFDRFYMAKNSRNSEWHGIWLSLVKKIVDIYYMKIKVDSELWKGTTFTIEF